MPDPTDSKISDSGFTNLFRQPSAGQVNANIVETLRALHIERGGQVFGYDFNETHEYEPSIPHGLNKVLERDFLPTYEDFVRRLTEQIAARTVGDVELQEYDRLTFRIDGTEKEYPLVKIVPKEILPGDRLMVITCGFHGNEIGSLMTFYNRLNDVLEVAISRGVKLIIYPLVNPSGYENLSRFNSELDEGDCGNNDFLRYQLSDGELVGDVYDGLNPETGQPFVIQKMLLGTELLEHVNLPAETQALAADLKRLPIDQIMGFLDCHQDNFTPHPITYQYVFGSPPYQEVVAAIARLEQAGLVTHVKNMDLERLPWCSDEYVPTQFIPEGEISSSDQVAQQEGFREVTDDTGSVIHHDGTIGDMFHRLGCRYSVTLETSAYCPQDTVDAIQLAWIQGMAYLIAQIDPVK